MAPDDVTYFEVDKYGTIRYVDFYEIKTRDDAFDLSFEYDVATPATLVDAAEKCSPLQWEIESFYTEYRENPAHPDRLDSMPEEREEEWAKWLLSIDDKTFYCLRERIKKWLSGEPRWSTEDDYIDYWKMNEGAVFRFFENETGDVLDALGVEIIEGDRPGSNYRGAELCIPIEEANAIAEAKGLSYRFRKAEE